MERQELEEILREYERRKYSHITTISILAIFGMLTQAVLTVILILFLR